MVRVVIIGAGIGGLTLAQALRSAAIEVRVYDRDLRMEDTGGYRLHLDPTACAVLAEHLPPELYQAVLASSVGGRAFRRFGFLDHRMRVVFSRRTDPRAQALQIGRRPLRRLLAHGLGTGEDGVLRLGCEFTAAEVGPDGTVTAHFADGDTDHADLLVGADGAHSRVAPALAGHPTARAMNSGGLVARTPLTDHTRALLPEALSEGPALAFGPEGFSVFLAVHNPSTTAEVAADACVEVPADLEPDYLLWGINADHDRYPSQPYGLDKPTLHQMARTMLRGWAPGLRRLVDAADPESVSYFRFNSADPNAELTPWPSGAITALGDAVHAMPPTAGLGASTAIRDAGVLARELSEHAQRRTSLPLAVHNFERDMAGYAPHPLRAALAPLRWQRHVRGPVAYHAARVFLPATLALLPQRATAAP